MTKTATAHTIPFRDDDGVLTRAVQIFRARTGASPAKPLDVPMPIRTCRTCRIDKELTHENFGRSDGYLREVCTDCYRLSDTRAKVTHRYGVTPEEYDQMLSAQNHGCAICGARESRSSLTGRRTRLAVDHDHQKEGREAVRGLLCDQCNSGLARFRDQPDRLRIAAVYLERFAGPPLTSVE